MESQYYIVKVSGEKTGPFSETEIRAMVASGQISPGEKLEDSQTGTIWEPSTFGTIPTPGVSGVPKKKPNVLIWVLVGLCVMCIPCIAVFAAILFPVFAQAKLAARLTQTMYQLKRVGTAVAIYQTDFDDKFPPKMDSVSSSYPYLAPYLKTSIPESYNPAGSGFDGNSSLAGQPVTKIAMPNKTYVFFDSAMWSTNRRVVLYADSSAKRVQETTFQSALANRMVEP